MIRHGWLIGLFWVFLLLGCAKEKPKVTGWGAFPVAIYADAAVVNTPEAEDDFFSALGFWEEKAGRKLFDYRGHWSGGQPFTGSASQPSNILANVVMFQNPWPFGANTAGMTLVVSNQQGNQGSVVLINPSIEVCGGDCVWDPYHTSRQQLLAHELGHFIGLPHSQDPQNLMYYSLAPGGSLENVAVDRAALAQAVQR